MWHFGLLYEAGDNDWAVFDRVANPETLEIIWTIGSRCEETLKWKKFWRGKTGYPLRLRNAKPTCEVNVKIFGPVVILKDFSASWPPSASVPGGNFPATESPR